MKWTPPLELASVCPRWRVRGRHLCRPLPEEPDMRLSPHPARARRFANDHVVGFLTSEVRALSCKQPLPSFPESNLRHGSANDAPRGSLHPFRSGQSSNPYAIHYRPPFAFSAIPYPLSQQLALRLTCRASLPKPRQEIGLTTFLSLPTQLHAEFFRLASVYPPVAFRRRTSIYYSGNQPHTILVRA